MEFLKNIKMDNIKSYVDGVFVVLFAEFNQKKSQIISIFFRIAEQIKFYTAAHLRSK